MKFDRVLQDLMNGYKMSHKSWGENAYIKRYKEKDGVTTIDNLLVIDEQCYLNSAAEFSTLSEGLGDWFRTDGPTPEDEAITTDVSLKELEGVELPTGCIAVTCVNPWKTSDVYVSIIKKSDISRINPVNDKETQIVFTNGDTSTATLGFIETIKLITGQLQEEYDSKQEEEQDMEEFLSMVSRYYQGHNIYKLSKFLEEMFGEVRWLHGSKSETQYYDWGTRLSTKITVTYNAQNKLSVHIIDFGGESYVCNNDVQFFTYFYDKFPEASYTSLSRLIRGE